MTLIILQRYELYGFEFNILKYSFLMQYLSWRIDTGNFLVINNAYSNVISRSYILINAVYRTRFIELVKQINN
jgi:hypothetical protein